MNAIKINMGGATFLLPEPTEADDYDFPGYILKHKPSICELIYAMNEFSKQSKDFTLTDPEQLVLPGLTELKRRTGIIGWPITAHDVDLYILDKNVNVVLEVEL